MVIRDWFSIGDARYGSKLLLSLCLGLASLLITVTLVAITPQNAMATGNDPSPPNPPIGPGPNDDDEDRDGDDNSDDDYSEDEGDESCDAGCPGANGSQPQSSTCHPIYLRYGSALERGTDLRIRSPGGFNWLMSRSYDSSLEGNTSLGHRWMSTANDMQLVISDLDTSGFDSELQTGTVVITGALIENAASQYSFTITLDTDVLEIPVVDLNAGSSLQLTYNDNGTPEDFDDDEFVLLDRISDTRIAFYGPAANESVPPAPPGRIKERSTRHWHAQGKEGFRYAYTDQKLTAITTPEGQDYQVNFSYSGNTLQEVVVNDSEDNLLQKVEYIYFDNIYMNSDVGSAGDLVLVRTSRRSTDDTGSSLSVIRQTHYRYDSESRITSVFDHSAVARAMVGESLSDVDDLLGLPDAEVGQYASRRFEYYASEALPLDTAFLAAEGLGSKYGGVLSVPSGWVKSETIGGCGACGDGTQRKEYFYLTVDAEPTDQNVVARIVVEDTVDNTASAAYRTVYGLNDSGRLLRKVLIEDPVGSPRYWCESWTMATTGLEHRLAEHRQPSAHDVADDADVQKFLNPYDGSSWANDTSTLHDSVGVTYTYEYDENDSAGNNAYGMRTGAKVKQGRTGTAHYIAAWDYNSQAQLTASYDYVSPTTTRGDGKATTYAYTYYDVAGRLIETKTTTLPAVPSGQNGSGVATVSREYYDVYGRLRWTQDGEGYINYFSYHPVHGTLAYAALDVDPGNPSSEITGGEADAWDAVAVGGADANAPTRSGLPTPLNLVSKTYYDQIQRVSHRVDAGGGTHYTLYQNDRTIDLPYWTGSTTLVPIVVTERQDGINVSQQYEIRAGYSVTVASGEPVGIGSPVVSDYVTLTRYAYNGTTGQLEQTDEYHTIPTVLPGDLGDHYHRTTLEYDSLGRVETIHQYVSGGTLATLEQLEKSTYDVHGRVIETHKWVTGNTPRLISSVIYDHGGVGDGLVTQLRAYHGVGGNDYTGVKLHYDFRGQRRGTEPIYGSGGGPTSIGPYELRDLNWQGQPVSVALYDTAPSWSGDTSATGGRRKLNKAFYDDLGRLYRSSQHKIDTGSGGELGGLVTDTYYDRNNNVVALAEAFGAALETAYDGAGRSYQNRAVIKLSSATPYSSGKFTYNAPLPLPTFSSMSGGNAGVLELEHHAFSADQLLATYSLENNHDDATGGSAGINLGSGSDYVQQTVYYYHDAADRLIRVADFGSGDSSGTFGTWKHGTTPARPSSPPSASSNTMLLTQFAYHADTGRQDTVIDPLGKKTLTDFDALGRVRYLVENFVNFDPSMATGIGGGDNDEDRVVGFNYNGLNQITELTAYNAQGMLTETQITKYLYEDAVHAELVTSEIYPDSTDTNSSGTNQLKFEYALNGQPTKRTDQRGTVRQFTYNNHRQLILDAATTLGGSTDSFVQSIGREYDALTRLTKVTSYAANNGSGTVRNQVQLTYNELDQVLESHQSHSGAVGMGTPSVQYSYDTTDSSSVFQYKHRLQSVTYPNGRQVFYDYNKSTADSPSNRISRIHALRDTNGSGTVWAEYAYNGLQRLAIADYPAIDVMLDHFRGTAGIYEGYDRFGRVKDQFWAGYGSTPDADQFTYWRDRIGNPTVANRSIAGEQVQQVYAYDGLHRLRLAGAETSADSLQPYAQFWNLDSQGNWLELIDNETELVTSLEQSREFNKANEIDDITETVGDSWTTPLYDAAGNMTRMPPATSPTGTHNATYDAWNRLRQISAPIGSLVLVRYEYDGLNRRTVKDPLPASSLPNNQYFYYNEDWQELEVRKEVTTGVISSHPLEQFVWHPYYIDALATRFYDADIDGIDIEQHYFTHDANFNVSAAIDDSGAVVERYHYAAYGSVTFLNPDFTTIGSGNSAIGNHTTYTGRRRDTESGLYHYRNRYYHPQLGNFLTRDPIGYQGSQWNLYEYVNSRPMSLNDPSGAVPIPCRKP